jgi:aarF domain-containing kinase
MTYTNIFPKTMFLDKLLEHTKKELYEECDYLVEAAKQERYR